MVLPHNHMSKLKRQRSPVAFKTSVVRQRRERTAIEVGRCATQGTQNDSHFEEESN